MTGIKPATQRITTSLRMEWAPATWTVSGSLVLSGECAEFVIPAMGGDVLDSWAFGLWSAEPPEDPGFLIGLFGLEPGVPPLEGEGFEPEES